jgi:hypothetical protein
LIKAGKQFQVSGFKFQDKKVRVFDSPPPLEGRPAFAEAASRRHGIKVRGVEKSQPTLEN